MFSKRIPAWAPRMESSADFRLVLQRPATVEYSRLWTRNASCLNLGIFLMFHVPIADTSKTKELQRPTEIVLDIYLPIPSSRLQTRHIAGSLLFSLEEVPLHHAIMRSQERRNVAYADCHLLEQSPRAMVTIAALPKLWWIQLDNDV